MPRSSGVPPRFLASAITSVVGLAAAITTVLGLIMAVLLVASEIGESGKAAAVAPAGAMRLVVSGAPVGRPIPAGYLGLSIELSGLEGYLGHNPGDVNPVFVALLRNISLGGSPALRIGGDSTDRSWWPARGVRRPGGAPYTITRNWLRVLRSLADRTSAKLILGVNFEADSRAAAGAESRAFIRSLGSSRISALELGNEPELYATLGWYRKAGRRVIYGRPPGYGFQRYLRDWGGVVGALPRVPLAGPTVGGFNWLTGLGRYLRLHPRVRIVTLHRYQLSRCFITPSSPRYPTIRGLLQSATADSLAVTISPFVRIAHAHHRQLRVDELNSVACAGSPNVSNRFASALWALDAVFEMRRVGADGVNIHTFPIANYGLFTFSHKDHRWRGYVRPEYYGLLMFAQAAPAGSRLLPVSGAGSAIHAWATRGADGHTRVVLINDGTRRRTVVTRVPGISTGASLERLRAPGLAAKTGITIGGLRFAPGTTTGALTGHPQLESVGHVGDIYTVRLPAESAALLTL
jgi:hypothetical protein